MKQFLIWLLMLFAIVPLQSFSPQVTGGAMQRELDALTQRGFTYQMLDNDLVELRDHLSGERQLKSILDQNEAQIYSWAAARGIPILEIDPNSIDTNQYAGWYLYWGHLPLSNGFGRPLVVEDVDRDGNAEVYGDYRVGPISFQSQIYQVDSNGAPSLLYIYDPRPGIPRQIADVDRDSLTELAFTYGGLLRDYEQQSASSLPTTSNFENSGWGKLDPGYTGIHIGNLDSDSLADYLYKGSECDSIDTLNCITKVYIAEHNQQINNFIRVWSTDFGLNGNVAGVGGFAVDDFDGDGKTEFAATELASHRVFVVENTSDNGYAWLWQDTTSFINLYYTASGDVDHDGKHEFFVGATSNGSWTTMYEADSNSHYSAKFIIHLLSGGLFDQPTFLTTDVDGDGVLELVIMSGNDLYVFKSRRDNEYYLSYLKREDTKDAVQFYDFNHDGRKDFIISKLRVDSLGHGTNHADYYRATSVVSVNESSSIPGVLTLKQNYPNPFNPSTTIQYSLPSRQRVILSVCNILGQRLATLVDREENPGPHATVWNAEGVSSGIYFCRLETAQLSITKKLLLIR